MLAAEMTDDDSNIVRLPTLAERAERSGATDLGSDLAWELGADVEAGVFGDETIITIRCTDADQLERTRWIITKGAMLARREYDQEP